MTRSASGSGYYRTGLAGEYLRRCYEISPPRIRQYLRAELDHVLARIPRGARVLDMGCGYGRVIPRLLERAALVVGIDNSCRSLELGAALLRPTVGAHLIGMDASALGFCDGSFDVIACIQNGISAFRADRGLLLAEALRVTLPAGIALFSTYAPAIWEERLDWFRRQSEAGLIGEIDWERTREGVIACRDGFLATTPTAAELLGLARGLPARAAIVEVDASSLFLELRKEGRPR